MGSYLLLVGIAVEHTFFRGDLCRGLDFVPTPDTAAVMGNAGLLAGRAMNGISVFYDEEKADALRLFTVDPDGPLRMTFKVFSTDPRFSNYTEPSWYREDSILYLDERKAVADPAGRIRLHGEEHVSPVDFERLDSPFLENVLDRKDRLVRPLCVISVRVARDEVRKSCYVRFKARETFWKYYLLGDMAGRDVAITDRDNKTEFECVGEQSLPDERPARVFRSTTAVPLRQRSEYCFQLREKRSGGGRYLIKRLPVASAERIDREMIDGKEAAVSEIYINC